MELFNYIKAEWHVLKKAPFAFWGLLILGLALGFGAGLFWRGQEVANYETLIRIKDGQIDDYKKSINDRLDKVEKTLSANQLSSLELWLKTAPSKVTISADPSTSIGYKKQIEETLKSSGWQVDSKNTKYSPDTYILETKDAESASVIAKALSSADVPFKSKTNETKGGIEFYLDK